MFYKGVDLITVSKLLGHKDTTITHQIYIHQIKELETKTSIKLMK